MVPPATRDVAVLSRPCLLTIMRRRFEVGVVTLVAGGGSARRRCCASRSPTTSRIPEGSMCCSVCSPADAEVPLLARRLAEALGLDASAVDSDAPLGVLCGALGKTPPFRRVCSSTTVTTCRPIRRADNCCDNCSRVLPATHTSSWRPRTGGRAGPPARGARRRRGRRSCDAFHGVRGRTSGPIRIGRRPHRDVRARWMARPHRAGPELRYRSGP